MERKPLILSVEEDQRTFISLSEIVTLLNFIVNIDVYHGESHDFSRVEVVVEEEEVSGKSLRTRLHATKGLTGAWVHPSLGPSCNCTAYLQARCVCLCKRSIDCMIDYIVLNPTGRGFSSCLRTGIVGTLTPRTKVHGHATIVYGYDPRTMIRRLGVLFSLV